MKRYGFVLTLLLIISCMLTPTALAAGNQWSLAWSYDGSMKETLTVPGELPEKIPEIDTITSKGGWTRTEEDGRAVYSREFSSWTQYSSAVDSLPVTVSRIDYIVWTMVEIKPAPDRIGENALMQVLEQSEDVEITITMPAPIKNSSSRIVDENSIQFVMASFEDPSFASRSLLYSSWFQWFEMGIAVLILGTLGIILALLIRMRGVDRLIDEEYSLERAEERIRAEYGQQPGDGQEGRDKEEPA